MPTIRSLVVDDLAKAAEIADKRTRRLQEAALAPRKTISLETLSEAKITELKVILKAEARGSIEAIRKELEKLVHPEVRVRILEAAIGGITENDVWLALTSPQDTLILGFNVVPDERSQALADERGIQIRQYNIIYNLTDDVRAALEGKLTRASKRWSTSAARLCATRSRSARSGQSLAATSPRALSSVRRRCASSAAAW